MKHVASLKYGVILKKAFCDPEIFTAFVKNVIGVSLEIDRVETEKEFAPPCGYGKPKFDLFAEDYRHRIVVDIQNNTGDLTSQGDDFMAYVICEPCIDAKGIQCKFECMEVCPVDCIYGKDKDWPQCYIHPEECIDCDVCIPECPKEAIFQDVDVPDKWKSFVAINAEAFNS